MRVAGISVTAAPSARQKRSLSALPATCARVTRVARPRRAAIRGSNQRISSRSAMTRPMTTITGAASVPGGGYRALAVSPESPPGSAASGASPTGSRLPACPAPCRPRSTRRPSGAASARPCIGPPSCRCASSAAQSVWVIDLWLRLRVQSRTSRQEATPRWVTGMPAYAGARAPRRSHRARPRRGSPPPPTAAPPRCHDRRQTDRRP